MNCKKATQLISKERDRQLPNSERFSLRIHLMMCRSCRHFQANLVQLHKAFQRYGPYRPAPNRDDKHANTKKGR